MKAKTVVGGVVDALFHKKRCWAVILAGGRGERMGGEVPKQFLEVGGIPVVVRTLQAFEACSAVEGIVIVTRPAEKEIYREYCRRYALTKVRRVTVGGETRRESAMCGLRAIDPNAPYIAIHDAARCFVTPEIIENVLRDAVLYGAAAAATPVKDTIKITDLGGFVTQTTERARTWAAATPQIFKTDLYRAAAYTAEEKGLDATDDCMLAEACGFRVKLCDCGEKNIKLTTPADLKLAELIAEERDAENAAPGKGRKG